MNSPRALVIAIDGPSGAGKGTVSRVVAERLHYRHVDTGAMYRAVAWLSLHDGIDLQDVGRIADIAARASLRCDRIVEIEGHDVTSTIRTPEIDRAAALVAQHGPVREVLVNRQRQYGRDGGVVMEGRDIGTVVFPSADVKFFLDASADERARRRAGDVSHSAGQAPGSSMTDVARELASRDRADRTRAVSPLTRADDAIYIDTTDLAVAAVVERVLSAVDSHLHPVR